VNKKDVIVDVNICDGTGLCCRALPQVFQMGVDGFAIVDSSEAANADEQEIQDVALLCPTGAIIIGEI
jgi:ferredoxin